MITDKVLNDPATGMNYMVSFPEKDAEKIKRGGEHDYPLIIYLHGAGERGGNIDHLTRHGIAELIEKGSEFEAVILCPQCPEEFIWNNMVAKLKILIDAVVQKYNIREDRIALTGSSMGGCGTLEMGMTYSSFFSAIAPVASDGLLWRAKKLKNTHVYMYHGSRDESVFYSCGEAMFREIKKAGGSAEFFTLEGYGHNDGIDYAYQKTDLIDRLIKARRTDFTRVPEICEEWF